MWNVIIGIVFIVGGLLLLAAKKFIVIGLLAVAGFFRKLFGMKPKNSPPGPPRA